MGTTLTKKFRKKVGNKSEPSLPSGEVLDAAERDDEEMSKAGPHHLPYSSSLYAEDDENDSTDQSSAGEPERKSDFDAVKELPFSSIANEKVLDVDMKEPTKKRKENDVPVKEKESKINKSLQELSKLKGSKSLPDVSTESLNDTSVPSISSTSAEETDTEDDSIAEEATKCWFGGVSPRRSSLPTPPVLTEEQQAELESELDMMRKAGLLVSLRHCSLWMTTDDAVQLKVRPYQVQAAIYHPTVLKEMSIGHRDEDVPENGNGSKQNARVKLHRQGADTDVRNGERQSRLAKKVFHKWKSSAKVKEKKETKKMDLQKWKDEYLRERYEAGKKERQAAGGGSWYNPLLDTKN